MIEALLSNLSVTNVLITVVSLLAYIWYRSSIRPAGFPPGPVALPVLGNILQLRNGLAYKTFNDMSKTYGDVFSVKMGANWCVVLNSLEAARDAFLKKPVAFAGRPDTYSFDVSTRGFKDIAFAPLSDTWKIHRKIGHSALRQFALGNKVDNLVHKILPKLACVLDQREGQPFKPKEVIAVAVYNIIATLCFGHEYSLDDPKLQMWIKYNNDFNVEFSDGLPADFIPILKHMPHEKTKRFLKLVSDYYREVELEMDAHKKTYDPENIRDYVDSLLKHQQEAIAEGSAKKDSLTQDHLSSTIMDIFGAGTDTTTITLYWAIALMAKHPDIQEKVAQEVDDVVGRDRPPRIEDRSKLTYSEAVMYEILRYSSVAPLGLLHATMEDTTLGKYNIPKGTWVMVNHWAIHYSEKHWKNPHQFNPGNFLDKSGEVRQHPEGFLPFSFGRRVCLGEAFAKAEILLLFTWLFQHYTFSPPPNLEGKFEIKLDTFSSQAHEPSEFEVVVKKRF